MNLSELYKRADYKDEMGMLFNCDCMELLSNLEDESISLVVTDPPYKTTSRGNAGSSGGMLQKDINKKGQVFKHNDINIRSYAKELYRVLKDGSHCYIMTNHVNLIDMLNSLTDIRTDEEKQNDVKQYGFNFIKSLVWDKGNKIMGQFYMSQFEYILFFRKGKGVKINNCGTSDILSVPNKKTKGIDNKNLHDTEKPIELMKILIGNSSKEGDIILEPFGGIMATCIGAKELNRRFIGSELDKNYFDIGVKRLKGDKQ
jgi:site-specific DNA-methyltransferase (adenine-specific)